MLSYHGKQELKDKIVRQMDEHAAADEIIKGVYWEKGKGCAVGCLLHSADHKLGEDVLGWPEWLMLLIDQLFEGQSNTDAKDFAVRIAPAIPVGVDLDPIKWQFGVYLLEENLDRVHSLPIDSKLKAVVESAIRDVLVCLKCVIETGQQDRSAVKAASMASARAAAEAAAESAAWSAAESAAESAVRAAAESAAWSAVEAAWSARSAEAVARSAARSAAEAIRSAEAAARSAEAAARSAAWSTAEAAAYKRYADYLISLLQEMK